MCGRWERSQAPAGRRRSGRRPLRPAGGGAGPAARSSSPPAAMGVPSRGAPHLPPASRAFLAVRDFQPLCQHQQGGGESSWGLGSSQLQLGTVKSIFHTAPSRERFHQFPGSFRREEVLHSFSPGPTRPLARPKGQSGHIDRRQTERS